MSTVARTITAFLHDGPHDGQTFPLAHSDRTIELSNWDGPYLADAGVAEYERIIFGQRRDDPQRYEAHYRFVDEGMPA